MYPEDPVNEFDIDGRKSTSSPWNTGFRYFTFVNPKAAKKAFKTFCGSSFITVAWNCSPGIGGVGRTAKVVQLAERGPSIGKLVTKLSRVPAKAKEMVRLINKSEGKKIDGYKSRSYHNVTQPKLPPGTYREFDVDPFVKGERRGPERIVRDEKTGDAWYSPDHYETWIKIQ